MSATAAGAPPAARVAESEATTRRRRPSGVAVGVVLIAVLVLVRIFVAEPFRIPSRSMEPTLRPGDQALVVNGRQVREPFVDHDAIDSVYFGPVRVKAGSFFAMGDNRANSEDSRDFGAVSETRIVGRAVARVWPPSRWGTTG